MNLLTAKELAKKLGVTIGTIYRMAHAGAIPSVRVGTGRRLRFDYEEVKTTLSRQPAPPPSQLRKGRKDPLVSLHRLAFETGIKDLAQHHDHYLYGIPIKAAAGSRR